MKNNPYNFNNLAASASPNNNYLNNSIVNQAIMSGIPVSEAMMLGAEYNLKQNQAQRYEVETQIAKRDAMERELLQERLSQFGINDPTDIESNFNRLVQAGVEPTAAATIATQLAQMPFQQQQAGLKMQADEMKMQVDEIKRARDQEDTYRKEYINQSKEFKDISRAYSKIYKALNKENPAPSDDMAAVYSLIKLYDPNTGVREGEYAKAEQLKGIPEWLGAQYNKVVNGNFLTPQMRKQLTNTAKDLYAAEKDANKKVRSQYKALSEQAGLNPKNVLLDYNAAEDEEELTQEQQERAKWERLKAIKERRGY